jgi:hypothetical protein
MNYLVYQDPYTQIIFAFPPTMKALCRPIDDVIWVTAEERCRCISESKPSAVVATAENQPLGLLAAAKARADERCLR